jgi:diaminopimelate decarboxylase
MPVDVTSTGIESAGAGGVMEEAVGWAGEDAVLFALARVPPDRTPRIDAAKIAGHLLDNPAYAVRYAHSRAASVPRWAAAIRPGLVAGLDREELALAYQLSWLPERVAIAARRGRPDEFARYLEELAYGIILRIGPASNLELAAAARTGLAAGLGLLGITAPDRLLGALEGIHPMSRVAHPAGPRYADVLPADHPPAPPADLNALHPDIWPRGAHRRDGVLTIGDVDVRDLATEFGTPVYVMDEADVRSRCRDYVGAFGDGVFYASKAFCSRAVLRWVSQEGLGVDVCTGGELKVALLAGVAPEMITLHGNNKLLSEITSAIEAGVGHVVADSFAEIARLAYVAAEQKTQIRVLVRVTTGVEAHTHEFMATAHDDQKFGFSLGSGDADEAVRRVLACPDLTFAGLHSHIGSQIFDTAGFEVAAHRVLELAKRIQAEHGVAIEELDLGGGFGIAYTPEDDAPDVQSLAKSLRSIVSRQCAEAGLPEPRLTIEPGRAIVGASTATLYEVGTIKDVDGLRTYVSVDGGMSDNIRTALYDASYTCVLASRASDAPPMLSRVVGRHCESGDIVVKDCYLPSDLATGDLLAVAGTGAYCWSLASNYNHLPRPGVVAVRDGAAREIVRRESLDDLLKLDVG